MKDVSLFLLKKVFKSRLNWIVLALFASVLGVTFYFNSQTANSVSLERKLETRLVDRERVINENEEKLSQISDTSSEEYQIVKNNLESQKNLLTRKTEILTLLKEGRWKEAYDLGASQFQMFKEIMLPYLTPSIIAGYFMAFTYSLDDFAVTFFVTGNGFSTLSVEIYSRARKGISLEINALSALVFLFSIILVVGYYFISREKEEQA